MGMLQIFLHRVPDNTTIELFKNEAIYRVEKQLRENGEGDICESVRAFAVPVVDFDQLWYEQENLRDTPEIKEKYRALATENKLIAVEIDW